MIHDLDLSARRVTRWLWIFAALLVSAHLIASLLQYAGVDGRYATSLFRRFDLDQEDNVPAFFSGVLLLVCAALLVIAGITAKAEGSKWVPYWHWLAFIFAYLAVDEVVEFHGFFSELSRVIDTGVFRFAWVLVYGPAVVILALVYLRFYLNLPKATRIRFTIAGIIYVGGALGMEVAGGAWSGVAGEGNAVYRGITTVEETMELAGLIVFVNALLRHTNLRLAAGGEVAAASAVTEPAELQTRRHRLREARLKSRQKQPGMITTTMPGVETASIRMRQPHSE